MLRLVVKHEALDVSKRHITFVFRVRSCLTQKVNIITVRNIDKFLLKDTA
jgi:hypothetical protein